MTNISIIDNNLFRASKFSVLFSMNSPIADTPAPIQIEKAKKLPT